MNHVVLIGRITKDIEVKQTSNQTPFCQFTIAVDRKFKDNNGNKQADFINCVAWRKTAELIGQHFRKGHRIGIIGEIQTRVYEDRNGAKQYVVEVLVDDFDFIEIKKAEAQKAPQKSVETDEEDLPFPF